MTGVIKKGQTHRHMYGKAEMQCVVSSDEDAPAVAGKLSMFSVYRRRRLD